MCMEITLLVPRPIQKKEIPCAQNIEFLNTKPGGTYSNNYALNG